MRELRPGVWHWQAKHPWWHEEAGYPQVVSSYAIDAGGRRLLFDPLEVPEELRDRDAVVVLTAPWHERDAEKLGLPVYSPPRHSAQDLIDRFGITREQAGDGSPDLLWLEDRHDVEELGLRAFGGRDSNDLVVWVEPVRALVCGDSLADFGNGLEIAPGWLLPGETREDVAGRLRPVLELPVELVLPAHGEPTDRATLERVLA